MSTEYLKLAVGNLAHRKTRSILTMIGIIIGIAAVIALISLGQGLETAVKTQFSALGSDRLIIQAKGANFGPPGQNAAATLTKDDLEVVQRAQYVRVAAGRLLKPATVEFNNREETLFLGSMPDSSAEERAVVEEITKSKVAQGRLLDINDRNKVVVGRNWGRDNSFGRPIAPGQKLIINGIAFEVVGVLEATGNPGFDRALFVNEQAMRDAVDEPDEYSIITAKTDSDQLVGLAADAVTRDLRRHRDVKEREEDFTVQTSAQLLETVFVIIGVIQAVLVGIAGISLIVGGIGIMNTMYTSVLQRRREVGIMKAIGATNANILTIFLLEAAILGVIGGAIGTVLGIGLAKAVEYVASYGIPSIVMRMIIGVVAGLLAVVLVLLLLALLYGLVRLLDYLAGYRTTLPIAEKSFKRIKIASGIIFLLICSISFIGTAGIPGFLGLGPGLLRADIQHAVVIGALIFSIGVGIISGLAPAVQASRMEPVEALNT